MYTFIVVYHKGNKIPTIFAYQKEEGDFGSFAQGKHNVKSPKSHLWMTFFLSVGKHIGIFICVVLLFAQNKLSSIPMFFGMMYKDSRCKDGLFTAIIGDTHI